MIQPEIEQLVAEIHATPQQAVLEFAGAGSLALFWLHSQGGSSRTVLEAVDRYAALSTIDLLGTQPRRFVTAETARSMASHAYQRGLRLSAGDAPVVGIGCTATIATDYAKRGKHGCRVCVVGRTRCSQYAITMQKGVRTRQEEEVLVSIIVLQGLARACGLEPALALQLAETEVLKTDSEAFRDPLDSLLAGKVKTVTMRPDGDMAADRPLGEMAMLSGAFNPLHAGHIQLARAATAPTLRGARWTRLEWPFGSRRRAHPATSARKLDGAAARGRATRDLATGQRPPEGATPRLVPKGSYRDTSLNVVE